jgi:putative nucleotidyltransferase with HDIG domain
MSQFDIELSYIIEDSFRGIISMLLHTIEPQITEVAASGQGHPPDESGPGGLILHCKRVAWLCIELCREFNIDGSMRDSMIGAAILHDIGRAIPYLREGDEQPEMHGKLHGPKSVEMIQELLTESDWLNVGDRGRLSQMYWMIQSHMSHWDPGAPQPEDTADILFATADYIASRPQLLIPVLEVK